jgi:hypothetical protein
MAIMERVKERMAEAVHAAVCAVTGGTGLGCCAHYAAAGSVLATAVTGKPYVPLAGSLHLYADPADPTSCTALVAEDGGIGRGEFHAWCVGPVPVEEGGESLLVTPDLELIDFSARHFKTLVETLVMAEGQRNRWRRADPPVYLWSSLAGLPEWIKHRPDPAATETLHREWSRFEPAVKLAVKYFHEWHRTGQRGGQI